MATRPRPRIDGGNPDNDSADESIAANMLAAMTYTSLEDDDNIEGTREELPAVNPEISSDSGNSDVEFENMAPGVSYPWCPR